MHLHGHFNFGFTKSVFKFKKFSSFYCDLSCFNFDSKLHIKLNSSKLKLFKWAVILVVANCDVSAERITINSNKGVGGRLWNCLRSTVWPSPIEYNSNIIDRWNRLHNIEWLMQHIVQGHIVFVLEIDFRSKNEIEWQSKNREESAHADASRAMRTRVINGEKYGENEEILG